MSENQEYLRPKEVCKLLSVSKSTFYKLVKRKDFPKKTVVNSRCIFWKKEDIEDFVYKYEDSFRNKKFDDLCF